jgi:hypothetical protein
MCGVCWVVGGFHISGDVGVSSMWSILTSTCDIARVVAYDGKLPEGLRGTLDLTFSTTLLLHTFLCIR